MRVQIFASGIVMLSLGGVAMALLERKVALEMLQGALLLGGGLIICGIFTFKMKWHGITGSGILALLGAASGLGNLPGLAKSLTGDYSRGVAPYIEFAFTLLCVALMVRVMRALQRERTRRLLEQ
ncbi:MAG: hypothetical protein ACO3SO_04305 [Luteolibacter sp.]|jgi:hypothetical protein